jgi:Peptidase M50B-like
METVSTARWIVALHESGHIVAAFCLGLLVRSATVRENHSGLTQIFGAPWPLTISAWGGIVTERLILAPEEIDESRSRFDMAHAKERARSFVQWSESRRVIRRLGPPPEPAARVESPALDAAGRADVQALVTQIGEKLRPHREARVLRLVALAERKAHEHLSRNLVTVRTVAVALAGYGFLDGEQLEELFHEGRRRQVEDDEQWRKTA